MFSDLLQYKRESFWEQHRIIQFDTLTAQAEYTVMAVFRGEAEDLFAYYQCTDAENTAGILSPMWTPVRTPPCTKPA